MESVIQFLIESTVEKLLIVAGLIFLLLAIIGKVGKWINLKKPERTVSASIGILLLTFGIILFLVFQTAKITRQSISSETLCPDDEYIKEIIVVLVDRTDPLYVVQRANLENNLTKIKESIPAFGKVVLFSVGQTYDRLLQPELEICNPGKSDETHLLVNNPKQLRSRWEKFSFSIDHYFIKITSSQRVPTSPIMESIQSISISVFDNYRKLAVRKRLYMISDMIQNTKTHSHYNKIIPFDIFKKTQNYNDMKINLEGVEVEIIYVHRDYAKKIQGEAHMRFWEKYFTDMGSQSISFSDL